MSSFFTCIAYDDVDTTIRLDDHVVFLALADKEKNTSVHLTLNPLQVRVLAKYLTIALSQMEFSGLTEENHFGNLTVQIVNEDKGYYYADNFYDDYAIAVPF